MKTSIIKIALSIVVLLSSFSIQSCKKESVEIAPTNTTIIGKWRAVRGNTTTEREFIKGATANSGTGNAKFTTLDFGNTVSVTTAPFTWDVEGNHIHISQVADVGFIFQLANDGNRLIFFDEVNTNQVSNTFERIK